MARGAVPVYSEYFNSQPHEEADDSNFTVYNGVNISTHSLTKRLTNVERHSAQHKEISTHSLTKRLTQFHRDIFQDMTFQLTASRRG